MPRKHTDRTRSRISHGLERYHARRREAAKVAPRDLARLRRGEVTPALRPLLDVAEAEAADIIADLGGTSEVTAQQRAIIEDLASVGIALRAELARYLQKPEPDGASRLATLATARRSSLVALGLGRRAKVIDWTKGASVEWSSASSTAQPETNGAARGSAPQSEDDRASERNAGGRS